MNTYIIGEIGQNHNGSVDIAKLIIDMACRPVKDKLFDRNLNGLDAIKFTKRDLNLEMSNSKMQETYDSPNSFGKTYGDHRKHLELSDDQHLELFKYVKNKDLDYIITLCSPTCVSILKKLSPDYLKVASRDLTNIPLLEALAETKTPIILSTGMSDKKELDKALEIITKRHSRISILHCLSEYPSKYENINLKTIHYLIKSYPNFTIGFSDHSIGISISTAAVAMGAKIIEKHITLDRKMKGTDQSGSLESDGLNRMIRDIRNLDLAMGDELIKISDSINETKIKLKRSLGTNKNLKPGDIIKHEDLIMISPGDGFSWNEKEKIIGLKVKNDILKNEIIYTENIDL